MKKAITILAVLIVLVSAVFAAETHKLTVRADVEETLPAFNLVYGGLNTNNVAQNVYGTNSDVAEPASIAYDSSSHTENGSADAGFNLNANGSFAVVAKVVNNVKTNRSYTLQFKGGVFGVKRNTVAGYYSPTQITVANGAANGAIKEWTGRADSAENNNNKTDTTSTLHADTTVTFSGKTGTGATSPITIATATFSYPGDDEIDPNTNQEEWYYADIMLVVTQQ